MSADVDFKLTLDVTGKSEAAVTDFCIAHLRERGYYVADPTAPWETCQAFCKRTGAPTHKLHELIARHHARGGQLPKLDRRGKSQRIAGIQSNPSFDAFCRSLHGTRGKKRH